MYDNTKFNEAFKAWLAANVIEGYGEHYSGDLLIDFEDFLRETKMLKRSPGRVVFGKALDAHGFDKRKRLGLTYYSGLELKNPPEQDALEPKRYRRTVAAQEKAFEEQQQLKKEAEFDESEEAKKARIAAFRHELNTETKDAVRSVGKMGD